MNKLRVKRINTSIGELKVKEFTYKKYIDYLDILKYNENDIVYLSFIFPKITEYHLGNLSEYDKKVILKSVKEVNAIETLPSISVKSDDSISLTFEETIDFLACRYSVTPLTIISQYSERQILKLNRLAFLRDMKSFGKPVSSSSSSSSSSKKSNKKLKDISGKKRLPPHLREV